MTATVSAGDAVLTFAILGLISLVVFAIGVPMARHQRRSELRRLQQFTNQRHAIERATKGHQHGQHR